MSRKQKNQIFTHIEVIDAGSKGKSVAKSPDGRVIFLSNAIPGDVVDIQTLKSAVRITRVRPSTSIPIQQSVPNQNANILAFAVVVNGSIWITNFNLNTNKKKLKII